MNDWQEFEGFRLFDERGTYESVQMTEILHTQLQLQSVRQYLTSKCLDFGGTFFEFTVLLI